MSRGYTYSLIKITTTYGVFETKYCDYYIQDEILTVIRTEEIEEGSNHFGDFKKHKICDKHYPMKNVVEIKCIK